MKVCMYMCTCTCIFVSIDVYEDIYIHMYMGICTSIWGFLVYVSMCSHVFVYMYMHMCMCMYAVAPSCVFTSAKLFMHIHVYL